LGRSAVLAVVPAGAIVTFGGVSLFVAFFVLAPMAHQLFRASGIPRRLMPAAFALGTTTSAGRDLSQDRHEQSIDPGVGAGTLESLPHNGAVVLLLAVCNSTHRESYLVIVASIVGLPLALAVVIILSGAVGSF
jgi:H+/gluconate symporter-like permease